MAVVAPAPPRLPAIKIATIYGLRSLSSNLQGLIDALDEKAVEFKDIDEWGRIVARYLKPGGTFYIMESHPIKHIFDDETSEGLKVIHKYTPENNPIFWEGEYPDYADKSYIVSSATYEWSWTVSDIINSLIKAGMQIEFFNEYTKLFYKGFPWMVEDEDGWWIFPEYEENVPLTFTLKCTKKS